MIRDYTANTNNKIDCFELGRQLGLFISETLEAKVDSYVPLVEAQKLQWRGMSITIAILLSIIKGLSIWDKTICFIPLAL